MMAETTPPLMSERTADALWLTRYQWDWLGTIAPRLERKGDCWLWQGVTDAYGYARIEVAGRSWGAHRYLFLELVGPTDLPLDHLCHTRAIADCVGGNCIHRRCVNPSHLEPVTQGENARRGRSRKGIALGPRRAA